MSVLQVLIGWVDLAATAVLVGGLAYALLIATPEGRGRYVIRSAIWFLAMVLFLEIVLNALRMGEISGIGGRALLADVFEMRWSHWWVLRLVTLAMIAIGMRVTSPPRQPLVAIGACALLARSYQGHAGAHGVVPAVVDWVHLSAASVWVGGLVQLALMTSVPPAAAIRASKVFTVALAPLLLGGIYGAFLHVASLRLLVGAPYGRVLVAKIALVLLGITFSAINHYGNVPAVGQGDESARRRLLRTVRVEAAIVAVVLLLSALLGTLPMPHAMSP